VAPGLYKHERGAFLPYLDRNPFFFVLGSLLVYFVVLPMLVRFSLGMQQMGGPKPRRSNCCQRSANICH
jgi:sec-independent protein translocase protein TatC